MCGRLFLIQFSFAPNKEDSDFRPIFFKLNCFLKQVFSIFILVYFSVKSRNANQWEC